MGLACSAAAVCCIQPLNKKGAVVSTTVTLCIFLSHFSPLTTGKFNVYICGSQFLYVKMPDFTYKANRNDIILICWGAGGSAYEGVCSYSGKNILLVAQILPCGTTALYCDV